MTELERIRESSQYLATLLRRRPEFQDWLWTRNNLRRRYPLTELYRDLQQAVCKAASFQDVQRAFREFKQRHFLRIGGRDLLGWADLAETTAQISDLARVTLQVGLEALSEHPEWWNQEGEQEAWRRAKQNMRLIVMGLGKLGGNELNYVSDVDILFLCDSPENRSFEASEDLIPVNRLCQWLMRLLSDQVEGDRVFQVDLRLRPQGKDGPLVSSLSGAAEHYLFHGRAWERQMLLKARPVAGDRSLGTAFLNEVRPFIFRRFLDFQALDEMRAMRDRILKEAPRPRPGWEHFDVKLGVGGIREIEFLVQSFQLIYGGRHPELEEPNTLRCMDHLNQLRLLPAGTLDELREAYLFLRRVEHWVQLDQNRQTQKLPQSKEALTRLSLALGFEGDTKKFLERLENCCAAVNRHFKSLFGATPQPESSRSEVSESSEKREALPDLLQELFPESYSRLQVHLRAFPSFLGQLISEELHPYLRLKDQSIPEQILLRMEKYFSQVRRRPGLVKLFDSPAPWLRDVCRGLAQSRMVSDLLSHQPGLVEGIATWAGECPDAKIWEEAGRRILERYEGYEEVVEWIRRLKNERLLQLALADLRGTLSRERLEEGLSDLADFVIRQTYESIRKSKAFGPDLSLAILTLGKLGSREMNYLSDLDLVFVYQPGRGESEDQIPQEVIRLIQRIMRMLSTPLQEGPGYEVDARLRPTGNYGPLAVTRNAWTDYYAHQADLWEIQALLRLRAVAGNKELGQQIESKAKDFCYQEHDSSVVRLRICHLRGRMELERSKEGPNTVDLKLGLGGLADLEFLAQGHQLIFGYKEPELRDRNTGRVLNTVMKKRSHSEHPLHDLTDAFGTLRCLEHRLHLYGNLSTSRLNREQFEAMCHLGLLPPKQEHFPLEDWQDLLLLRRRVRQDWQEFCSQEDEESSF